MTTVQPRSSSGLRTRDTRQMSDVRTCFDDLLQTSIGWNSGAWCSSQKIRSQRGIAPTETLKSRTQMAAAAGKKESVLSLFMKVNNLEVEEDLSTMATLFWWKVCA